MKTVRRTAVALAALVSAAGCRDRDEPTAPQTAESTEAKASTNVAMSPAAIAAAGVVMVPVTRSTLTVQEEMPGTIEAPRDALVVVNTRAAGVLEALEVDVGDRVTAGQRLATVRSVELAKAQADYRRSVVAEQYAASTLERLKALYKDGLVSQRRVEGDQLAWNQSQLGVSEASEHVKILGGSLKDATGMISIVAPIAGGIAMRNANRGEAVAENAPLFTIVDASRLIVQLRAPGGVSVSPGTAVGFTVDGLPGQSFTATVKSASDIIDPETRRVLLRCTVENPERLLKPGMFVSAKVPRLGIDALTVPEQAVQVMEGGTAVFVAKGEGKFERRNVVLGTRAEGRVAVTSGLVAGEMVVAEGAFWVRTELQKSELEE